jgi:hypothetical protein
LPRDPRTGASLVVWCKACRHQEKINFDKLMAMGKGDVRVIDVNFRCTNCRSRLIDFVVTGGAGVRPW